MESSSSLNIPWYCDEALLPQQLPTIAEIHEVQYRLSITAGCDVVVINEHFAVKYGLQVDLLEGETMHFLHTTTSIPVPRVYALFQDQDTKRNYIVMEHIHGITLEKAWPDLSKMEKEAIMSQLRLAVQKMSLLSSTHGYCSYGGRALTDSILWTPEGKAALSGPFESQQDFNDAIITNYLQQGISRYRAVHYRRVFDAICNEHKPSFTHGDLQRKNIMIKKGMDGGSEPEVVIIDWEFSGWYPSYWEYCKAIYACGRWSDDWSDCLHQILEPSFAECGWIMNILRDMWT